jgi:hypothetical protein
MPAAEALVLHGGAFAALHQRLVGVEIDFSSLDPSRLAEPELRIARAAWQERVRSEYRSAQLLAALLGDALAAGDPFDVHAGLLALLGALACSASYPPAAECDSDCRDNPDVEMDSRRSRK